MKTFDTTSVSGLLGETTTCGHVTCTETATLRLNNTIKIADDYVYQIVIRSAATSNIVLKIGTQSFNLASTTSWQRLIQKFTIENNNTNYIDLIFSSGEYWFYNAKLETGIIATAWTPAPEDFDIKLYSLQSEFNQRADSIEMSISKKQDIGVTAVRYIRDWLDGNNVDNKNYWGEINVITHDGENVLDSSLIRLQAKNEALSTVMVNNIENIKDGTLSSYTIDSNGNTVYHYSEDDYVINTGKTCIEIDLGQIYNDIDYIRIWHRFADGKFVFNHKLQTSIDGVTWVTLYDSSITGGYEESVDGKLYYLNESNIISSMNKLSMTLNETRSQLSDTSGNLSTLTQTVKGINETVSKNYEDANSALVKLREDLDAKISETEKALANFRIEAGNIYATAESVDKNNNKLASLNLEDYVLVSINFEYKLHPVDYLFVGNSRRMKEIRKDLYKKVIASSNVPSGNVFAKINYSSLLNKTEYVKDNSGLMFLKLLSMCDVNSVKIIGMDGYLHKHDDNYISDDLMFVLEEDIAEQINLGVKLEIKKLKKELSIEII